MTFDDGPGAPTQSVLTALKQNGLKATFHVTTEWVSQVQVVTNIQQADKDGHVVGLRFPTKLDPSKMSDAEIEKTLSDDSEKIFNIIKKYPKFLRLPYGKYDSRVLNVCSKMGFVVTLWNIDVSDYSKDANAKSIVGAYNNQLGVVAAGAGRYISVHHDIANVYYDSTVLAQVASTLKNAKYTAVTLDKCLVTSPYRSENLGVDGKSNSQSVSASATIPVGDLFGIFALASSIVFVLM